MKYLKSLYYLIFKPETFLLSCLLIIFGCKQQAIASNNYVCKPDTFKWECKGASGRTIVDSPAIGCPVRVDVYWGTKK